MNSIFAEKVKKYKEELREQPVDFMEIAESDFFYRYLQGFLTSLTGDRQIPAELKLVNNTAKEEVKASRLDGKTVLINIQNPLIHSFASRENKMFCVLGYLFHEIAHMKYMDYRGEQYALRQLQFGRLPYESEFLAQKPYLPDHYLEAVRYRTFTPVFVKLYTDLAGLVSDYHDEERLCRYGGTLIRKGILTLREAQFASARSVEDMAGDENFGKLATIYALILQYARFGRVFALDEKGKHAKGYVRLIRYLSPELDGALNADNTKEKYHYLNVLVSKLWPLVELEPPEASSRAGDPSPDQEKELEYELEQEKMVYEDNGDEESPDMEKEEDEDAEEDHGSGSGSEDEEKETTDDEDGGGGSSGDEESCKDVEDVIDELEQAAEGAGADQLSDNPSDLLSGGAPNDSGTSGESDVSGEKTSGIADLDEFMEMTMDSLEDSIIEEKAQEQAMIECHADSLMMINTGDMISSHKGIQTDILYAAPQAGDREAYEASAVRQQPLIRRTEREIRKIIQEENNALQRRRIIGRRLDTKSLYKADQRYYQKKKMPDRTLDIAIAILVDNSGSMRGRRLDSAKEATILLHEVLERLEIPDMIAGHNCQNWPCIRIFRHFDDTRHAKYAVSSMQPAGDNRDGLAIQIIGQYLTARDEKDKLLIIVSDGQPNAGEYSGAPAKKDIQNVVRGLRQKGVKTIAFAIGDDKEQIHEIYGEAFVDITDYDKFPRTLAKMIEREIVERIG